MTYLEQREFDSMEAMLLAAEEHLADARRRAEDPAIAAGAAALQQRFAETRRSAGGSRPPVPPPERARSENVVWGRRPRRPSGGRGARRHTFHGDHEQDGVPPRFNAKEVVSELLSGSVSSPARATGIMVAVMVYSVVFALATGFPPMTMTSGFG